MGDSLLSGPKPELLPCPFCGGDAAFERLGSPRQSCIVSCDNCGCRLEANENWDFGTAWNTRADAALAEMGGVSEVDWQPLVKYDTSMQLVQVLCEVTEPELSEFPRSCEMPISASDNGVGEMFVSIGWQDDEGVWFVAGWDMMQDCWTDARCFDVKMWQPIAAIEPAPSVREAARVLLDEWRHGEGPLGELCCYSMGEDGAMQPDIDGRWVEFTKIEAALIRAIAEGKDDE